MAKANEVLQFLRPDGGYVMVGDKFEDIVFESSCEPFTKAEYEAGFAQYDSWKAEQEAAQEAKKAAAEAKLLALGLDLDDLRALGL